MTLRARLFILVTLIILLGIPSTAAVFTYISWQSMVAGAEGEGMVLAQQLAQSIKVLKEVPVTVEEIVGNGTVAGADLVANLTQLARQQGASAVEINHTLQSVAAHRGIPEIWVTDTKGRPVYSSLNDIDAAIGVDLGLTQQSSIFRPLLEGGKSSVFAYLHRNFDDPQLDYGGVTMPDRCKAHGGYGLQSKGLYYGGVAMPDRSGIVLIGRSLGDFKDLKNRVGLERMMETIIADSKIDNALIFDIDSTAKPELLTFAPANCDDKPPILNAEENKLINKIISEGKAESHLAGHWFHNLLVGHTRLHVAAPIFGPDGLIDGVTLIRMSIDMQKSIHDLLMIGGGLSILLLLLSLILALPFVNHIVRPLNLLTVQTHRLEARNFKADQEMLTELAKVTHRHDEVAYLGSALHSMVLTLETYIADLKETTAAKERIECELSVARRIQMSILSHDFELPDHPECDLHAMLEPAKAVGGDLYDFFLLDDHRLFFLIGDVSDKGVPAALFMAVTKTLFTTEAQRDSASVGCIMERVNTALCKNNSEGMFVTVFAGILDLRTGAITYSDGGHERPFVLRGGGRVEMFDKKGGLVLGFMPDSTYQEDVMQLAPGEGLVIYTDGVSEAMNTTHELFKVTRLNDALASLRRDCSSRSIINEVLSAVRAFVGNHPQSDDITLLALRWRGPGGVEVPRTLEG